MRDFARVTLIRVRCYDWTIGTLEEYPHDLLGLLRGLSRTVDRLPYASSELTLMVDPCEAQVDVRERLELRQSVVDGNPLTAYGLE